MERTILAIIRGELTRQANRLEEAAHFNAAVPHQAIMAGEFDLERVAARVRQLIVREIGSEAAPSTMSAVETSNPQPANPGFAAVLAAMQAAAAA